MVELETHEIDQVNGAGLFQKIGRFIDRVMDHPYETGGAVLDDASRRHADQAVPQWKAGNPMAGSIPGP